MSQPNRLAHGGRIERNQPISFVFNGRRLIGLQGDTLASALLANGVKVVARSFKFHRPRGILSCGVEEPNALLAVDSGNGLVPITRPTLMPLITGLHAQSQGCFPSVNFDLGRTLDYTRCLWPSGFYNKIFKWPNWHIYEPSVRRLAGLGYLPDGTDSCRYRHLNEHCDTLIVGSGPAGLDAALTAGRRGEDVLVVEQDTEPGGALLYDSTPIYGQSPDKWHAQTLRELKDMDNVRILTSATVTGYYDHNVLTIHDRTAAWQGESSVETFRKVRAARVILATGAIEQPLLFGNNDLPGIMLAGAVHQYAARYGVKCGERSIGLVNNDLGWRSILSTNSDCANVAAIIDFRSSINKAFHDAAEEQGIAVYTGAKPLQARGSSAVKAIRFRTSAGRDEELECDLVAMSSGLNPTVHLFSQAGGKVHYRDDLACFIPGKCRQNVTVVGAASGNFATTDTYNIYPRERAAAKSSTQWVDYQHDATVSDVELAVRENYISVEHLKRYTTIGMSVDQGKTSNLNAILLLGELTGRRPGQVGTTTFRPHYMPVTLGAIAGNRSDGFYAPTQLLAAHDWHVSHDATFEDYGSWKRPAFYGGNREQSIAEEAHHVREHVGLFDASPLGKIDVRGPDAAEFLNRVYVNKVPTLKPGRARYGLMINENGVVLDDGVFVRLSDDHFLVNTTSGNATRIAAWLDEWHQCEWPDLDVVLSAITEQWAVATLAGPNSRRVLGVLDGGRALSPALASHMTFSSGTFSDGTPYRIQRVSFSGELSYEISVPTSHATSMFQQIWEIGQVYGLRLFGVEALMLLRTEKGFLHVGVDTDGTTTPLDLGFGGAIANKDSDFIGSRSLRRSHDRSLNRRQLVGFELPDSCTVHAGAHFVVVERGARRSEGFVTSAYSSPVLGKTIGLGLLERGFERKGESVAIYDDNQLLNVRIVDTCFFDPAGDRMRD